MTKRPGRLTSFIAGTNQPLVGVILQNNGQPEVHYFADATAADSAVSEHATRDALSLAGIWSDLNWSEMEAELEA